MARAGAVRFRIVDGRVGTARVRSVTPVVSPGASPAPMASPAAGRSDGASRNAGAPRAKSNGSKSSGSKSSGPKFVGPMPQQLLTDAASVIWGDRVVAEYDPGVPGRRFRIDLAFPAERIAVAVDGWQFHGRMKGDFDRERERQNLLTLEGWRILRYPAGVIRADLDGVIRQIAQALEAAVPEV